MSIREKKKIITLGQYLQSNIFYKLNTLEGLVPNYHYKVNKL
jgi:hypothetical protein